VTCRLFSSTICDINNYSELISSSWIYIFLQK